MALFEQQVDSLVDYLERISPRDRMMLGVIVAGVSVLVLFLGSMFINGRQRSMEDANDQVRKKLVQIKQMQGKFEQARRQVQDLKRKLNQNRVNLMPFLDKLSQKYSISISSMNPETVEVVGKNTTGIKEEAVRIQLQAVPLASLAKFLDAIENSGKVVKVRKLKLKPNFSDSAKPDVDAVISTYVLDS